jgi:hypothetical protein
MDLYRTEHSTEKGVNYVCVLLKNGDIKPLKQSFDS